MFGVLWVLIAGVVTLIPALMHGASLGSFDQLSGTGLSAQRGVVVHNSADIDQITAFIPWATLAWSQVHHAQLPLWNPYSALGMPLAFNWQSAVFSAPAVVGYLFPIRFAYTVQIVVTLAIAGTGAYALCKVLRLSVLACAFAATVFELSGPIQGWLGFPMTSVMSWAGWLFAGAILILRGGHRARNIAFVAVVVALMVFAGHPETAALLGMALVVFVIVTLTRRARWLGGSGQILRPLIDLGVATAAGCGLAAPLILPGLQLAGQAARGQSTFDQAIPTRFLVNVLFQGFDGLQVAGSRWFPGFPGIYPDTAAYVGIIALVLALVAVALQWGRPEVIAFGAVAIVMALLAFATPLISFASGLPLVSSVGWHYALLPMAFAIAVLAGFGMEAVVRHPGDTKVRRLAGAGFCVVGLVILALWVFGRGHLPPVEAVIRAKSFILPVTETILGLAAVAILFIARRDALGRRRTTHTPPDRPGAGQMDPAPKTPAGNSAYPHLHSDDENVSSAKDAVGEASRDIGFWTGAFLLACETVFLVTAGAPLMSSSAPYLQPTSAEIALHHAVGSSVVGYGAPLQCLHGATLGILPDVNIVYGVQELGVYDPIVPDSYFQSWQDLGTGQWPGLWWWYCPTITTANVARLYGVSFVLERAGSPGPRGGVFDTKVGNEDLYRIPGAAVATVTPITANGSLATPEALGDPVVVSRSNPASWKLETHAGTSSVLRLRLTNVPGWNATIDGRPLRLRAYSRVMLEAGIPPGRHLIELSYWPAAFTDGIVVGACSLFGLACAIFTARWRARRRGARIAQVK